jgi:hypothetical protein
MSDRISGLLGETIDAGPRYGASVVRAASRALRGSSRRAALWFRYFLGTIIEAHVKDVPRGESGDEVQ